MHGRREQESTRSSFYPKGVTHIFVAFCTTPPIPTSFLKDSKQKEMFTPQIGVTGKYLKQVIYKKKNKSSDSLSSCFSPSAYFSSRVEVFYRTL